MQPTLFFPARKMSPSPPPLASLTRFYLHFPAREGFLGSAINVARQGKVMHEPKTEGVMLWCVLYVENLAAPSKFGRTCAYQSTTAGAHARGRCVFPLTV